MGSGGIRVRSVVDRYYFAVVGVALILVVVGGVTTYSAYTANETETRNSTEVLSSWESTAEYDHQATAVSSTRTFSAGETLAGRSVYFRSVAPVLDGEFEYTYTASEGGDVTANATVELVARSVDESGTTEYWQFTETVSSNGTGLGPGDVLSVSFARNMTEVANAVEDERQALDGPGTTETYFRTTVSLRGTRNGQTVDKRRTYRLPVTFEDNVYRVNDTGPVRYDNQTTDQVTRSVAVPPGPLRRFGGPLALFVGIVGAIGLVVSRYTGRLDVTEDERAHLAYRRERAEFDEWITRVRAPPQAVDDAEREIETTTLAGLVDLAIDTDRRVLELDSGERYVVHDGDVRYTFEPPEAETPTDPLAPEGGDDAGRDPADDGSAEQNAGSGGEKPD